YRLPGHSPAATSSVTIALVSNDQGPLNQARWGRAEISLRPAIYGHHGVALMPAPDGKRNSLASYTWGGWGSQNDVTRFRDVFQPDRGSFSPSYPLVPPERERVRLWDYPVGYNAIYTPRSYEAIGFDELRALAESHDITRLAIETRKDQIEKLDWTIKSRNEKTPDKDAASRIDQLTEF